MVENLGLRD